MAILSDKYQEKFLALQIEIAESDREIKRKTFELQQETMKNFLELVAQKVGRLDLISRDEVADTLNISKETLRRWEKMGLARYSSPTDSRGSKVFYRPSDLYNFLLEV